jgi:Holliday junction DNA helicase RuvA
MIRSLKGTVASLSENKLVVEVNDIGYLINTPTTRLQFVPGDDVFFHTHLVVRENILDLYGFIEIEELSFFELLLSVPKIGPKSALQILTLADVSLLATAILQQDPDHLHKMAGIGKKTAVNIVTTLAGKVESLNISKDTTTNVNTLLSPAQIDAIDALITLGYDPKEARAYIIKLDKTEDTKTLIQAVLKQIPIP